MLIGRFSDVILLLDGDDAGRRATDHIGEMLRHAIRVRVGMVPSGRQPDCLRADEIAQIINSPATLDGRRP
jgi:DNA primase